MDEEYPVEKGETGKMPQAPKSRDEAPPLPSGNDPAMLSRMSGWNWGACVFTWIWMLYFGMQAWGIIVLVGSCALCFVSPIASIILGMKGNEWAWRYKSFRDFEQYQKAMKDWNFAGIVFTIASLVVFTIFCIALYSFMKTSNIFDTWKSIYQF
jgi:hypothetical protein